MSTLKEYIHRANNAKNAYESFKGIPTDQVAYNEFFVPPVCNKTEGRLSEVFTRATRRGAFLYDEAALFPLAEIGVRSVFGLDRWVPKAPKRVVADVVIKNPWDATDASWLERYGVRNALVVYSKANITHLFVGGVMRKNIYVIRPVMDWSLQEKIMHALHKHIEH